MSYSIERVDTAPIVIVKVSKNEDLVRIKREAAAQIERILAEEGGSLWRITDYTDTDISFSDMVFSLAFETSGAPGTASDPRIKPIFVGESALIVEKARSAAQKQYGELHIPVFGSLDEAVAYAQQQALA